MTEVVDEFKKNLLMKTIVIVIGYFRGIDFESNSYSHGIPSI